MLTEINKYFYYAYIAIPLERVYRMLNNETIIFNYNCIMYSSINESTKYDENQLLQELIMLEEEEEDKQNIDQKPYDSIQAIKELEEEATKKTPIEDYREVSIKIQLLQKRKKQKKQHTERIDSLLVKKNELLKANPAFSDIVINITQLPIPKQLSDEEDIECEETGTQNSSVEQIEDAYHNVDCMMTVATIENELEVMQTLELENSIKQAKIGALTKKNAQLKEQVQSSQIDIPAYTEIIKKQTAIESQLLEKAKNANISTENIQRIEKRVQILDNELNDILQMEEEKDGKKETAKANERCEEYTRAAEYYIKQNNKEKAQKMIEMAKQCKAFITDSKLPLPAKLSPEIFIGMSNYNKLKCMRCN